MSKSGGSKVNEKTNKNLFKELPYFNYRGRITDCHGRFNNLLPTNTRSKNYLDALPTLYDLDVFKLNSLCDKKLNIDSNLFHQRIKSRYFTPHSFKKEIKRSLIDEETFSLFHSNVVSLGKNLENLQSTVLNELDFDFSIIGITETKINSSDSPNFKSAIPGYKFEHTPTPLSFGGVALFIDESLDFKVIEKTSNEAYQALWIVINFSTKKNVICGILYRQHNSPENFLSYFE